MRKDVLVYTSSELKEDLEVIGYINAMIYASTSAKDTDFFIKLVDVTTDGISYNVTQGGRRGRYLKKDDLHLKHLFLEILKNGT